MFVLPFDIPKNPDTIKLKEPVFSVGSCFADNIGSKLKDHKFDVESNPLGTIYNPSSIFKNLRSLLSGGLDTRNCIKSGDIYYHWDTHSTISAINLDDFQNQLKNTSTRLKNSLLRSAWIIITLGTAKVYKYLHNGEIVANCHKIPGQEFDQSFLTSEEIVKDYFETVHALRSVNPDLKVILTVSPVRHVRDGLVENNYSKSILLQAVYEINRKDERASYFPAYELQLDILRDYRFYQSDMIHPTPQAIDYIWDRFVETYMDEETRDFIIRWKKIKKSLTHKPFHPSSSGHQSFIRSTIKQLKALESKIDVSSELNMLEKQLV